MHRRLDGPDAIGGDVLDVRAVLDFFHRRWTFIAGTAATVLAMTLFVLFTLTPLYTGVVQVLLDPSRQNLPGAEAILSELTLDSATVDSQVSLITSRTLLRRVVESENLTEDPEFGSRSQPGTLGTLRTALFGKGSDQRPVASSPQGTSIPHDVLTSIGRLQSRLEVSREGRTYVIKIALTSEEPRKAARLANAVANAYVVDQLEARLEAARRSSEWLSARLEELQVDLRKSEEAVELFRQKHGLIATRTGTINEQQLSELNSKLIIARSETAERRAKYEQAQEISAENLGQETIPDVLRSPVISNLRSQQAQVSRRLADLISRYGSRHPQVVNARAEKSDIDRAITAEVRRIIANLKNDYEVALSREQSLEQSLEQLTGKTGTDNQVAIQLQELERKAAANKALYEAFLARSKIAEEQSTFQSQDSRIISPASTPGSPSFPRTKLIAALALVLGLGLGTGGAYLLELLNAGFTTPRQVEEQLELPVLASTPRLLTADLTLDGHTLRPEQYMLQKPLSRYSEAVRSLRSGIQMSDVDNPPKVVLITSAMPGEGKSTLAISLAYSAASSGQRVVLVDCDLRHPSVSKTFGLADHRGLVDLLTGTTQPEGLVHRDGATGIHILGAGTKSQNPPDLLGSQRMELALKHLRQVYDFVIIDTTPVEPVIDATILSRRVDKVVFAVKWATTPREAIGHALRQIPSDRKVAGIAMTIVDERKTPKYGPYSYYGSSYYSDYYTQ